MKKQHVIGLIAVAAVLAGAVWFLNRGSERSWRESSSAAGGKVLDLPINDVGLIAIATSSGKVNLARKNDAWVVQERGDYTAAFDRVSNLLRKVWDLKTVQEVKAGESQFQRLELTDPPQGTGAKLDFKDKDGKQLGTLLIGKKYMRQGGGGAPGPNEYPAGRYVMAAGSTRVSLVSEMFDDVDAKPESWLSRDFVKIENPSAITLLGTSEPQKWKLVRENPTAEWKLDRGAPNEKVDQTKVSPMASSLASLNFADVYTGNNSPAETGLDKPATIAVETFDHFNYLLKSGKEIGSNQPVTVDVSAQLAAPRTPAPNEKPEDKQKLDDEFNTKQQQLRDKLVKEKKFEGRIFLIPKATIDQLLKDRAALLAQSTPTPSPAAPMQSPPSVTTSPVAAPSATKPSPKPSATKAAPKKKP